jgi:hypothetical protein
MSSKTVTAELVWASPEYVASVLVNVRRQAKQIARLKSENRRLRRKRDKR